jgi:hypothetical protein
MVKRVRTVITDKHPNPVNNMNDRKKCWKELSDIVGETIPLDGIISVVSNKISIDILKLDQIMQRRIPDYDSDNCTYKGENKSMRKVMEIVYGKRAVELTELLIH